MDELRYRKLLSSRRLIALIISLVIIPSLAWVFASGYMERVRLVADAETVRHLNTATNLYALGSSTHRTEVFAGITSDEDRLAALVTAGLYNSVPEPQSKYGQFLWHEETRQWTYTIRVATESTFSRLLSFGMNKSELPAAR